MKLEKEAVIKETLTNIKTDENEYPFYIKFKMMLNEKERQLMKKRCTNNVKLVLNIEEPILDDAERKYLKNVIRPFRDKIRGISKKSYLNDIEFIIIYTKDSAHLVFPDFKKDSMYKGMELNKEYTVEDLNL